MATHLRPQQFVAWVASVSASGSLRAWALSKQMLKFWLEFGRDPNDDDPVYETNYQLEGRANVADASLCWLLGREVA